MWYLVNSASSKSTKAESVDNKIQELILTATNLDDKAVVHHCKPFLRKVGPILFLRIHEVLNCCAHHYPGLVAIYIAMIAEKKFRSGGHRMSKSTLRCAAFFEGLQEFVAVDVLLVLFGATEMETVRRASVGLSLSVNRGPE
jgi:hypothetical protein